MKSVLSPRRMALLAAAVLSTCPPLARAQSGDEQQIRHNYTFGFRSSFSVAYSKQDYLADRLSPLNPGGDVTRSGGVTLGLFFSRRRLHAEFELQIDSKASQVEDTTLAEVELGQGSLGGWMRFEAYGRSFGRPPGARWLQNRVSVQPGVFIAYTSASVDGRPRGPDHTPRPLLEKKATTFALGVFVEVRFFRGLGASVDYRYRFAEVSGAVPENEGTGIFTGSPEFDFTGHMVEVGLLYRAPFNLFR